MHIRDFKLERYFVEHKPTARYFLSSSDCDGFPLSYVLGQASEPELSLWEGLTFGYTECAGHPILREAILGHYAIDDIDKVVVASPGELNFVSMNVLLDPGDHVISISPSYQSLYEVVRSIKCELSFWRPDAEDWTFDVMSLEELIQPNTKLIILNFPHNPTGTYLSRAQQQHIVDIARKHGITIFSDEMYHKLVIEDTEELIPMCDLYEKGISLWGTSKSFGLPGLRTGWLVSQDQDFLNKVVTFKDYLSICNSAPSEILSIIALNKIHKFVEPNIQKIKANVTRFKEFAMEHNIVSSFIPPTAGSTAFVKLNIKGDALSFSNTLVKETGIMAVPAEMFGFKGPYIRIGFGRESFAKTLEVLAHYLRKKMLV